jgi:hypothetical protein
LIARYPVTFAILVANNKNGGETMENDRRSGIHSFPANLKEVLNDLQILGLHQVEEFGWSLLCIRQPLFQDAIPVVCSPDKTNYAVIETDGRINRQPGIQVRD